MEVTCHYLAVLSPAYRGCVWFGTYPLERGAEPILAGCDGPVFTNVNFRSLGSHLALDRHSCRGPPALYSLLSGYSTIYQWDGDQDVGHFVMWISPGVSTLTT